MSSENNQNNIPELSEFAKLIQEAKKAKQVEEKLLEEKLLEEKLIEEKKIAEKEQINALSETEKLSEFAKLIKEGKEAKKIEIKQETENKKKQLSEKFNINSDAFGSLGFLSDLVKAKSEKTITVVENPEYVELPPIPEEPIPVVEIATEPVVEETTEEKPKEVVLEVIRKPVETMVSRSVKAINKIAENTNLMSVTPVDKVAPNFKAIQEKLKFLEQWIAKISTAGAGSGSYWLNDLGDTDKISVKNATNLQVLTFDATKRKWIAADAQGGGGTGAQGAQGYQGDPGTPGGPPGPQGIQGSVGPQGTTGSQGALGAQGAQGAIGPQGVQGAIGSGTQGAQGIQGATGPQGVQGAAGNTGSQGLIGAQGPQGYQGVQGALGTGAQGAQGVQGAVGAQGIQGVQGATGSGTQGVQGATGAQGVQGATGPQGVQGATGTQGATGAQGVQGDTGNTGPQGVQGSVGAQGVQGATGAQGSQGVQGAVGPNYQNAYNQANTATTLAQASFNYANTAITTSGGTITGSLTVNGTTTSNSSTAFIAGSSAISAVALQMPNESALRNLTNGSTNMYFDVSTGGTTHGQFQFRSSSNFTNVLTMSPTAFNVNTDAVVTSRTPSFGRLPWNSAIDTELTIDNYRFRVSNQGGNFPQIISNTGGTVNSAWTAVAARSGSAITQTGSTGILLPNNTWTSLYTSAGMDSSGDTITVTLQDKGAGRIYRITFMRSDSGGTGYNIIAERLL